MYCIHEKVKDQFNYNNNYKYSLRFMLYIRFELKCDTGETYTVTQKCTTITAGFGYAESKEKTFNISMTAFQLKTYLAVSGVTSK
jgi:hypothetical protein